MTVLLLMMPMIMIAMTTIFGPYKQLPNKIPLQPTSTEEKEDIPNIFRGETVPTKVSPGL